ncbi:MAG TPA: hypothetical protein VF665_17400 [Longimicrobium sp.]|jgi:pimeloyl-ACP methyl ester carboxylesterase|uniref:alpha/beta fold hydrolase n=1 Tax=Longimicrobium sp. TaxID=2029185 RepID=UPI002EDAFDDF
MRRVILLPGMDGTGRLFRDFAALAPAGFAPQTVALPAEELGYDALARRLGDELRVGPDCIIVAESFSGPLGIRLAAKGGAAALVLCNSFVAPPRHRALRLVALPIAFRAAPPAWAIRHFLVGAGASAALVDEVRAAIASVPPAVLAARLAAVLTADAARWLPHCPAPILYLRGTRDRLVPDVALRRISDAHPTQVARMDAPHLLLQAAPAAAWSAITRFLDR